MRFSRLKRWLSHPVAVNYGFSIAAFVLGLGLTVWMSQLTLRNEAAIEKTQFTHVTQEAVNRLHDRFKAYSTLVKSGQALFASSDRVAPEEWRTFVNELSIHEDYPAVVAFDYIAYVPDNDLAAYEREMQVARPRFELHYMGEQPMHCIVQYEAPLRENSPSIGGDACKDAPAYAMMQRALVRRNIVVSEQIGLETRPLEVQTGVIMGGPIFRNGNKKMHGSIMGWAVTVLALHRILDGVVPAEARARLNIQETDDSGEQRPIIYNSQANDSSACDESLLTTPCLGKQVSLDLPGGRRWTLFFHAPGIVAMGAWKAAGAGFIISLLLGLTLLRWGNVKTRALALARDMTRALRRSEHLLSSVTDNIFEGIYRSRPNHGMEYLNKSLATMFGYNTVDEMRAIHSPDLHADPARLDELVELLKQHGEYRGEEVEFIRRDGSRFIGVNNALAVFDDDGNIDYWDGAITDITARKAVEERVWYLARYDSLTGLANRASFRERVGQKIAERAREGGRFGILFVDLDRFKVVNDYLGHDAGDKLLKAIAGRIQGCLGPDDIASRQGGDEFLVMLSYVTDATAAVEVAEQMLHTVAGGYSIDAHDVMMTSSIGISLYPAHGDTVETLIRRADGAMYRAKANGRYNVEIFTPELDMDRKARAGLENDLREALRHDQLTLHYQPQMCLASGRIIAAEALLRWQHPTRGMISPGEFIPVAEQSGLIVPIGEWVLREACRQNREWQRAGLPIVPIAVNISAVQFLRHTLDETIHRALDDVGLDQRYLELELTETVVMQDIGRTGEILDRLQRTGIRLAIDDFGTGYSSLSYLHWFNIDKLKIDQSFVRGLEDNPDDVAIIQAVIGLARSFKLRVLAEGVETAAQLRVMRAHGCDEVQGFYFSKAVPADEFARLLRTGIAYPDTDAAVGDN